jgi:hypothetical protein
MARLLLRDAAAPDLTRPTSKVCNPKGIFHAEMGLMQISENKCRTGLPGTQTAFQVFANGNELFENEHPTLHIFQLLL